MCTYFAVEKYFWVKWDLQSNFMQDDGAVVSVQYSFKEAIFVHPKKAHVASCLEHNGWCDFVQIMLVFLPVYWRPFLFNACPSLCVCVLCRCGAVLCISVPSCLATSKNAQPIQVSKSMPCRDATWNLVWHILACQWIVENASTAWRTAYRSTKRPMSAVNLLSPKFWERCICGVGACSIIRS